MMDLMVAPSSPSVSSVISHNEDSSSNSSSTFVAQLSQMSLGGISMSSTTTTATGASGSPTSLRDSTHIPSSIPPPVPPSESQTSSSTSQSYEPPSPLLMSHLPHTTAPLSSQTDEDYLNRLQLNLRKSCTAHISHPTQRIFYMNHETRTTSWLPPVESWQDSSLPYGWETAVDHKGKPYYINHVNKTTTYHDPRKSANIHEDPPPKPREIILERDPEVGFGFVAGSERPVIVRFVTEGGPSDGKLQPGDEIHSINSQDVRAAPREQVIDMVKSCKSNVTLVVCQPHTNNTTKKSALLTATKKAKLRNRPSKVRFAEGVVINGSPLFCSDLSESFIPNVMKVFLENGQTKSFKYDNATSVADVLQVLKEKMTIGETGMEHFGLVVEHVKSVGGRRHKITLLDPRETLAKMASLPGSHNLRCLFRISFMPVDAYELLQNDPASFEYLYVQSCNDLVNDKLTPPLEAHVALKLASLHLHQHVLSQGMASSKIANIKVIENECGLTRFVPNSLLETMKKKQLRKLLAQFMKQNEQLCTPGQKQLTPLQAKLNFLKILSDQPAYGCRILEPVVECANSSFSQGEYIFISPRCGLCKYTLRHPNHPPHHHPHTQLQAAAIEKVSKNSTLELPIPSINDDKSDNISLQSFNGSAIGQNIKEMILIENLQKLVISKEDDFTYIINIFPGNIIIGMEERPMLELLFILRGYHQLMRKEELDIEWNTINPWDIETPPVYHGSHTVIPKAWSYCCNSKPKEYTASSLGSSLSEGSTKDKSQEDEEEVEDAPPPLTKIDLSFPPPQYVANESINGEGTISRNSSTCGSQRNLDYNMNLANRFELSSVGQSSPSISQKPVETINHKVVTRHADKLNSPYPVRFNLGDDEGSATPDLIGSHTVPLNKQTDDSSSINESTSSGETGGEDKAGATLKVSIENDSDESTDSMLTNNAHLNRSNPDRNSLSSNSSSNSNTMQTFGIPLSDSGVRPLKSNFANYTDTLRKYEAMAVMAGISSAENSITRIELPFDGSLGTFQMDSEVIDLTMIPPPLTPEMDDLTEYIIPPPPPPVEFCTQNEIIARFEQASRDIFEIIQTPPPKAPPRHKRSSPEPVKPIRLSQHLPIPPPNMAEESRFSRAQQQVTAMVVRLNHVKTIKNQSSVTKRDPIKLSQAHDALIGEARQFVTSSKLLVKAIAASAAKKELGNVEAEKLHDHLITCVALLDRMFTYSETVLMQSADVCITLIEQLCKVANDFNQMLDPESLSCTEEDVIGGQLGSSINSLMRILRT